MGATVIDDIALVKVSTQPRSGAPDGNLHFNTTTGEVEIIIDTELATVDFGAGPVPNPFTLDAKPTGRVIYEVHQAEREGNEAFRRHRPFMIGRFKLAGSYDFVYGRNAGADRARIAQTGWREFGGRRNVQLNRIYFSVSTLAGILDTSQAYYQLIENGPATDFVRPGNVDEAIQVFGTTANGDAGAGDFDTRTFLATSIRTYGQRHGRVALSDFGTSELEGYATLAALDESPHPTTGNFPLADVRGGAAVAPFTGISFDVLGAPETKTGFNEADGPFSLIIRNTLGGSLDQVIAWIDAASAADEDIADTGSWNGKQQPQLYAFNQDGIPVFSDGVFIEGIPTSDLQRFRISDDNGTAKTFPFIPSVQVSLPEVAVGTPTGYYHAFVLDGAGSLDYDTDDGVTMQDNTGAEVKGSIGALSSITFGVGYDTFNLAGLTPGNDFDILFQIGSNGDFEEEEITIRVTRDAVIPASISTQAENNI